MNPETLKDEIIKKIDQYLKGEISKKEAYGWSSEILREAKNGELDKDIDEALWELWGLHDEDDDSSDESSGGEDKKKEKFKAHGKINSLYQDCNGVFVVSGLAKTESSKGKDKVKEKDIPVTGSVTGDEFSIVIDGREFSVPAKVKIK